MAAPLLDHLSREHGDVRFKALKFSSFAEMGEALRNDKIQVAFPGKSFNENFYGSTWSEEIFL
ncbi:MAG: hypothetical protein D3918_01245, partial [Candidatus Electrothrix sp. AX2]|nr:hypothetical protein [Candidatus Electrothrix gigas]